MAHVIVHNSGEKHAIENAIVKFVFDDNTQINMWFSLYEDEHVPGDIVKRIFFSGYENEKIELVRIDKVHTDGYLVIDHHCAKCKEERNNE